MKQIKVISKLNQIKKSNWAIKLIFKISQKQINLQKDQIKK